MVDSSDLAQVHLEAEDIARSVAQRLTTAHLLLALFTVENRAQLMLKERGVDEDALLEVLTSAPQEADLLSRELFERAREIARSCGSSEADCLHLLIACTRIRCLAQDLLIRVGVDLTSLRNNALSYYIGGRMPRKLQLGRAPSLPLPSGPSGRTPSGRTPSERIPSGRPLGAPPSPLPSHTVVTSLPPVPPALLPSPPPFSARDLVDEVAEADTVSRKPMEEIPSALPPAPVAPPYAPARPTGAVALPLSPPTVATPSAVPPPSTAFRPPPTARSAAGLQLDPKTFPLLNTLGRNLSMAALEGKLDPVVGRAREIDEVIDVLGKRRTNNPCLVGEPGVGKTAVVEGVAQRLLQLKGTLGDRVVVELDMATLVAGTQLRGSFSEKLNGLKDEVKKTNGRVVVFIDEIHTLVGAGATGDGPQDAANELKTAMARGEFPCIGATTHDEFRKFISADPALERRFTPVVVNEPSIPETITILQGLMPRYEQHHGLRYAPAALEAAASLAAKYVSDRFLPDKAISIADLAGSRCNREGKAIVEVADVARIVAKLAGLPEERLLMTDSARLLKLEEELSTRVIGHTDALQRIAKVIRRNYAGFSSRRPMGSFLFLGPTGVGKTEMARALAEVLFGSKDALIRLDMSEMAEGHGISRLIGAPAGYVGHGDGGQLTEPVRRRPSSVVVLDEIEKAHREVQLLLLQVLEEGRLTDGKGRHIDFSNTVLVMTTNLGAEAFGKVARPLGFGGREESATPQTDLDAATATARRALPPELWNRIDERLPFGPLDEAEVARIAALLLTESSKRLFTEKSIRYVAGNDVVQHLLRSGGYDPKLGARPMRQTVQRLIEAPLAEKILAGEFNGGDTVRITFHAGALTFHRDPGVSRP